MAIFLLFAATLAAAAKIHYVREHLSLLTQARTAQTAGDLLAAEELYNRALAVPWAFGEHRGEIDAALLALQPVTQAKRVTAEIAAGVEAASAAGDVPALLQAHERYRAAQAAAAKAGEDAKQRFAEAAQAAGVEAKLTEAYAAARKRAAQQLEAAIAAKGEPGADGGKAAAVAAADLLRLPAAVYGSEAAKRKEANALLQRYDNARIDAAAKTQELEAVLQLGESIRSWYAAVPWEAPWLASKLDKYAVAELTALEKKDLPAFLAAGKAVQAHAALLGSGGGKAGAYAEAAVKRQFARAEQLAGARKYDEALELYRTLGSYRDTAKEIAALELRRLEGDPAALLAKAGVSEKPALTAFGKAADGSAMAAGAIAGERPRLVLARLAVAGGAAGGAGGEVRLSEGQLPPGLKLRSLRFAGELSPQGRPLLAAEAESAERATHYLLYELPGEDAGLELVLDVEADKLTASGKGKLTAVRPLLDSSVQEERANGSDRSPRRNANENTVPQGEVAKGYLEYKNGRYELVRTELAQSAVDQETGMNENGQTGLDSASSAGEPSAEEPLTIQVDQLTEHPGQLVRFQVTLPADGEGSAVVRAGNRTLLLKGLSSYKAGSILVTGTYTGEEEVRVNGGRVKAYAVKVSDAKQPAE
ncbi:hypothetical protein [Paenibacillus mucilaginosus]|uniref:hypothetical protein n=1 Tax=Paenibacillus mucilaginosus TaxID=61624 RepID=UPI001EF0FE01|nr:hypothetical protein [Paenibacillus mucilaginosus]MCG7214689.1 hypothetical protein [Paenibacillus mucilaginosus]